MSTELLVIEKLELVPFFTKGDQLDDTLGKIRAEAVVHVPDVSSLKGRNAIKANVTKVKKSRSYLESHGKDLSAEYKAIPKVIDANRKKSRDFLTELEAEIRAPLTAWEVIDKAEKAQVADTDAFLIEYELQHEDGHRDNELFDLKAKQAEADRQAEIKAAVDKAAADAKAKAEQEAAAKIAQAEREKIAAEHREAAAKQAIIDAETKSAQDAIDAAARETKAKQDVVDAQELAKYIAEQEEQRRIEAEKRAKRNAEISAQNARDAELRRQTDEADRIEAAKKVREADLDNRHAKNVAAKNAIVKLGFNSDGATALVKAIVKGLIPGVTINY